jgi:hypothetical protein
MLKMFFNAIEQKWFENRQNVWVRNKLSSGGLQYARPKCVVVHIGLGI